MTYEMHPRHYRIHWLVAALALILLVTFFPYIFGGKTFLPADLFDTMVAPYNTQYGLPQAQNHYIFDGLAQTYPYKKLTKEALEKGTLAYWNPHILGGYPQYAESLANNFDVFNILLLWFDPIDVIHWETVLELFVAGIGMLLLLKCFGVSPIVNLIFASAYMLNSMFITSAHYRCTIASFCWMPLVILMVLRFFYTRRKENLFYASIFLALTFLGGNFQTSFFAAFIVSLIVLVYPSNDSAYKFFSRFGILAAIGTAAFALSAIMWLPSLELLIQTIFRGGSLNSTNVFDEYSIKQRLLSIPLLIMFFFPAITGNAQSYNLKKIANIDIMNFNGAIGFLPALFALWGCYIFWKEKKLRPFIIISVSGIVLPVATPLFALLYHRFFIVSSFSLCIVGAVTFESFLQNENVRNSFTLFFKWTKIIFGIVCAILILACTYIALNYQSVFTKFTNYVTGMIPGSAFGTANESWMYGRVGETLHYYSFQSLTLWLPIISALVIILSISWYRKGKISQRNSLIIILFATVTELVIFATAWFPVLDIHHFPIYPQNPIMSYLQKDTTGGRYTVWRDGTKDPYIFPENFSNIYNTFDLHGYETCTNRSMIAFYKRNVHTDSLDLRLLGLAHVKYVIVCKRVVSTSNLRRIFSADSATLYENILSKPRAYFAYRSKVCLSDTAAASELLRPDFDGSEVLFTKKDAPQDIISYTEGKNNISFEKSEDEEIVINAQTDSKGVFVLTDTYYPGWKCLVNGKERAIYRVNYCMRGVILEPGTSTIIFRFEPEVFHAGMGLSLASILLCLFGILILKKRKFEAE